MSSDIEFQRRIANLEAALQGVNATLTNQIAGVSASQASASSSGKSQLRETSIISTPAITPNADTTDLLTVTALATNAVINLPIGNPYQGQRLIIRIKDDGNSHGLTPDSRLRTFSTPIPAATTPNKTVYIDLIYNKTDSTWDIWNVHNEV